VELLAVCERISCSETLSRYRRRYSRELPPGAFRARQSPSSGVSRVGSFWGFTLPNLLGTGSSGAEGLNLLPMVQCSSLSAAPAWPSEMEKPEPFRRADGASGSATFDSGRDDLQSLASSGTVDGGGRSPGWPSKRRREDS
jgi:hypothetical protein